MATLTGKTIGQLALLTGITSDTLFAVEYSGMTFHIPYSGLSIGGGGSYEEVTYEELYSLYTGGTLTQGGYYLITDFQSIYDQPDFDNNDNPIITGNSKTGITEPLLVFATSSTTLSNQAFSPQYPNDKISYDITFTTTEVSNTPAKGRITERIDEFNNRTDYDHRNILFKRYRLYTIRQDQPLNGQVELQADGTVLGQGTTFTALTVGDVIFMNADGQLYEITGITDNTTMGVSGDSINTILCCNTFYKAIEETNGTGYFGIRRPNVKSSDFLEYTTFGDAISNDYAKNNYVGNYSNNYQNVGSGTFLLANNVFLEGQYESNKFGDYCYNNTFGTDNQNNTWGDYCYENVSTNDIDGNIIGHYFYRNLINVNLVNNIIGTEFHDNELLAENNDNFEDNLIGNNFRNNLIYSRFYKNEILDDFNNNIIGDFGNLTNFEFYRNYIRNRFGDNIIRYNFNNNQIGTNYRNNTINGEFQGNTILNGYNNNRTGDYFGVNNIGNGFNDNTINDGFYYNTTDYYFNSNIISNDFNTNKIGTYFTDNRPSNNDLFGWNDLSTVSTRTYSIFNNVVGGGNLGNRILGKEFVMRIISTSQYFKIIFTQWTQGGNGGGFQYTREEIDSNGNYIGPTITFTKTNYGSEVDIIVPGVVEITRGNQNGIYNIVTEGNWNSSVSPDDTEWNSIYTQSNNGERFAYNRIGSNFRSNIIGSDFGYGGGNPYGNVILDDFTNNTIGQFMYNNVVGNYFTNNTINDNFENNTIQNNFERNTIDNSFENNRIGNFFLGNTIGVSFVSNTIGDYFGNVGGGSPGITNQIFDNFQYNQIGNNFGNDGSNSDGGNIINNNFQNNVIGDNFYFNACDEDFTNNQIGNDVIFNQISLSSSDNRIGNVFVGNTFGDGFTSNNIGNYFAFNIVGTNFTRNVVGDFFGNSGLGNENNLSSDFTDNQIGNYFGNDGTNNAGGNITTSAFTKNQILSTKVFNIDFTSATYVYDANMTKVIFDRQDGTPRLSFYDNSDVLNIVNINN